MLDYAWIIPVIPAVSFVADPVLRQEDAAAGLGDRHHSPSARRSCSSCVTAVQWIQRVNDAADEHGLGMRSARSARDSSPPAKSTEAVVHAGHPHRHLVVATAASTSPSARQIDGLAVMMLFVVTLISLLVHIYSTGVHARRRPLHLLLRRAEPLHRVDAHARRRLQHPAAARRLGARRPLLVHAHRALVGGEGQHQRGAEGVPHHPHRRHRPDDRRDRHVLRRGPDLQTSSGSTTLALAGQGRPHDLARRRVAACSSASSARAVSSRCTPGCPTPWPARRRCPR